LQTCQQKRKNDEGRDLAPAKGGEYPNLTGESADGLESPGLWGGHFETTEKGEHSTEPLIKKSLRERRYLEKKGTGLVKKMHVSVHDIMVEKGSQPMEGEEIYGGKAVEGGSARKKKPRERWNMGHLRGRRRKSLRANHGQTKKSESRKRQKGNRRRNHSWALAKIP